MNSNSEILENHEKLDSNSKDALLPAPRTYQLVYYGIVVTIYLHIAAAYGIYLEMTSAQIGTILMNCVIYNLTGIGVTAGAHRLWSHRAYKAKPPLQVALMLFHSMSLQITVLSWARSHRVHHKYCDTDADPHNASRGFFFSHMGWFMVKAHDDFKKRLNEMDVSDIMHNPILKFQKTYAVPIIGTMCFVLPTVFPAIFWGETISNAWHINILRLVLNLHATFLINSAAHLYGNKPYDIRIMPTQNLLVSLVICGEGFHNYHHSFPWDYRAAELCNNFLNLSSLFIDFCAYFGWAYDLKTTNEELVRAKAKKTGDGTNSWGYSKLTY